MSVVNYCQLVFQVDVPSVIIKRRLGEFETLYNDSY